MHVFQQNHLSGKAHTVRFLNEYNQTKVRKLFVVCLINFLDFGNFALYSLYLAGQSSWKKSSFERDAYLVLICSDMLSIIAENRAEQ